MTDNLRRLRNFALDRNISEGQETRPQIYEDTAGTVLIHKSAAPDSSERRSA